MKIMNDELHIMNLNSYLCSNFFDAILYFLTKKDERNYKDSRVA